MAKIYRECYGKGVRIHKYGWKDELTTQDPTP